MIVESGRVVRVETGAVIVESAGQSNCPRCAAGTGCGGALMGRVLGNRLHRVRALDGGIKNLAPGDAVTVGLAEAALVSGAATVYLVPLAGLFAGMLTGRWMAGAGDLPAVVGAVIGLLAGLLVARGLARRSEGRGCCHPVVVGRESAP